MDFRTETETLKDEVDEYGRRVKSFFIMTWGNVLKKFTTWAAALASALSALQVWMLANADNLALIRDNRYYAIAGLVITLAIPVLGNIRQKSLPPAPPGPPSAS